MNASDKAGVMPRYPRERSCLRPIRLRLSRPHRVARRFHTGRGVCRYPASFLQRGHPVDDDADRSRLSSAASVLTRKRWPSLETSSAPKPVANARTLKSSNCKPAGGGPSDPSTDSTAGCPSSPPAQGWYGDTRRCPSPPGRKSPCRSAPASDRWGDEHSG